MDENEIEFTVDSHLLGELGERLVTRNYIALSELVKNAYDADATELQVRFINTKKGKDEEKSGEIHLVDNGHGMTFEEVKNYWMRVATPYKLREPISIMYGRVKTGDKGIGRFACRRLARRLTLETVASIPNSQEFEWTRVVFDWEDFKPGTTLTEVKSKSQTKKIQKGTPGLTLILSDLVELWSDGEFNVLRRRLLELPIVKGEKRDGYDEDPGFEIKLDAPDFPKGVGVLVDQYMDAGWGKMEGCIDQHGVVTLDLSAKRIGTHKYELPQSFEDLSGIKFEIAWIPTIKDYFRDKKIMTKGLAELTREQGGVRVYLDGFRIYPYGDPDDDWLGIDKDVARRLTSADNAFKHVSTSLGIDHSRSMLNHPQNRHLIGKIIISSHPHSSFIVKADREGFIRNESFNYLVRCIRMSLQWFVLHYNKFIITYATEEAKKAERKLRKKLLEMKDTRTKMEGLSKPIVEDAVDVLTKEAKKGQETLPLEARRESRERIEAAAEVIQQSFSKTETYLNILRSVASAGTLLFVYTHEIREIIAKLDTHANTINRIIDTIPPEERRELEKFSNDLRITRDRLDKQLGLVGTFARTSTEVERKPVFIEQVCKEIVEGFEYLIEHYGINEPKWEIPKNLQTGPMMEAEVYSIIANLFSNAVKAVLAGGGKDIEIKSYRQNERIIIRVYDDGIGLSTELRDLVFEPLVADPSGHIYSALNKLIPDDDLAALGRGSGLGLTIVKGIVETYGGDVCFIDTKPPWKTCVEVIF